MTARDEIAAPGRSRPPLLASWWGRAPLSLLLADEDPAARAALPRLMPPGVRATVCADGAEALWQAGRLAPAVVILSATLPLVSAAEVAGVLVRHRDGLDTIAVGVGPGEADRAGPVLVAGAGRVISRPYRSGDLEPLLRECLERRVHGDDRSAVLTVGPLQLDGPAFEARAEGQPIRLTLREFELLRLLMIHAGTVVSHQQIQRHLGEGRGRSISLDSVAVHVRHLRARLAGVADIVAVRGLGYRLSLPVQQESRSSDE